MAGSTERGLRVASWDFGGAVPLFLIEVSPGVWASLSRHVRTALGISDVRLRKAMVLRGLRPLYLRDCQHAELLLRHGHALGLRKRATDTLFWPLTEVVQLALSQQRRLTEPALALAAYLAAQRPIHLRDEGVLRHDPIDPSNEVFIRKWSDYLCPK